MGTDRERNHPMNEASPGRTLAFEGVMEVSQNVGDRSTPAWRRPFLAELRKWGSVTAACRAAGITPQHAYRVRRRKARFAKAWKAALVMARKRKLNIAEREVFRRAVYGRDEPIYQGGQLVGQKRKRSDALLVRILEAEAPRKYRTRYEAAGAATVNVLVSPDAKMRLLTDPVYANLICQLEALEASPTPSTGTSPPKR
jgi:hypothetical protein